MYIYEAKGLDIEGLKGNGIIVAPEYENGEFVPAKAGDTCLLLIPYFDEDTDANCVFFIDDYTVEYSEAETTAINEGYKVFAFQGEAVGQFGPQYGKLKGLIFKSVTDQSQMTPELADDEIIFGIADEMDLGDGYQHLSTPIQGQVVIANNPYIKVDQSSVSVVVSGQTSIEYETVPHISDSQIDVKNSDSTVCSVTLDKGKAQIQGLKAGETTITLTITVNDKDYFTTIAVTVTA